MKTNVQPVIAKAQQNWTRDGITKNVMLEVEIQRKQLSDIEHRLDIFSSPSMQIKMSTFPRNKLDLHCQLLSASYSSTKKFSAKYPGKNMVTRCSYGKETEFQSEKIDVETEFEELGAALAVNQLESNRSDGRYDL